MSALRSRRVQFAGLLMLSSGMPLGFVMNTLQVFLRGAGVSLKTIGLLQVVSIPWSFKFLWAPLVDRFALPWLGRRRGWIAAMQLALTASLGALAAYVSRHLVPGPAGHDVLAAGAATGVALLALAIAFFSATQDIALDAYTVEVLEKDEVGPASGLRIMWYRIGMLVAGALAIFASEWVPWAWVFASLGAVFALLVLLTLAAPEPRVVAAAPRTFQEAVVEPFRNFFGRSRAVEVALFLVFYKFGDNLGGSMVNPFLKDLCFGNAEIGLMVKTIGTAATIAGAGAGAALMTQLGIGRALWVFGFAQAGGNLLYALAAATHPGRHRRGALRGGDRVGGHPGGHLPGHRRRVRLAGDGHLRAARLRDPALRQALRGDAVRAALQPLRAGADALRTAQRLDGRVARVRVVLRRGGAAGGSRVPLPAAGGAHPAAGSPRRGDAATGPPQRVVQPVEPRRGCRVSPVDRASLAYFALPRPRLGGQLAHREPRRLAVLVGALGTPYGRAAARLAFSAASVSFDGRTSHGSFS